VPATTTLLLAALVCVGAGWASAKVLQPARERYETLFRLDNDKPFQTRLLLARKAWNLFLEHPWTGVGLGRFAKERVEVARLAEADWMTRTDFHKRSPHNSYAKALAETGLVGFLPLAALWLALGVGGFGAALKLTLAGEGWAAPVYASLLGMSLHLWTISGLTGTAPWFVYGLAAAVIERGRRA
jgi:O-antigen ligase